MKLSKAQKELLGYARDGKLFVSWLRPGGVYRIKLEATGCIAKASQITVRGLLQKGWVSTLPCKVGEYQSAMPLTEAGRRALEEQEK